MSNTVETNEVSFNRINEVDSILLRPSDSLVYLTEQSFEYINTNHKWLAGKAQASYLNNSHYILYNKMTLCPAENLDFLESDQSRPKR